MGDDLNYLITATNVGTSNLTNATIDDDLTGDTRFCGTLDLGVLIQTLTQMQPVQR